METSKRVIVEASAPFSLASVQREDAVMHAVRTSLPTVYFHTLGGLPLYAQTKTPSSQDTLPFALPASQSSSRQALSLLTLHVPSGMHLQQPGQKAGVPAPATRAKSAGKHMCPYCGRDCLKPSVLEKHLRCHTGERPYPCTTCGVAFKTQSNLYKHKRTQAHARLSSSDSERDSLSSQESVPGSRATCWSTSSLEGQSEGSSSFEKDISVPASSSSASADVIQVPPAHGHVGPDTGWLLQKSAAAGLLLTSVNGKQDAHSAVGRDSVPNMIQKQQKGEQGEKAGPSIPPRHLSLQRQEATFFSKQWDSHTSGGKSQNHDSTDSGFSESSEQLSNPSPGGTLHDHSMESLAESSVEDQEELRAPQRLTDTEVTVTKGSKNRVSLLEKRKLEERICRLISENDALVDDKTLENVRPRKTLPSKQGSIDLPMPYTYKDSFHFEMKTSRQSLFSSDWQNSEKQVKQALYSSVPTQRSVSLEHAPLVRSSSLPFNMGSSGFERSRVAGSYQTEGTQQSGRDRTEHGHPSDLLMRSMEQPTSHPRSLVRQKAVDCIPAAELLNLTSCTEENYSSGPSGEGTSADPTGESSGGKCRRKKLPKFSYNKWYMYGDGAFRKLCNIEKGLARNTFRAKKAVNSMEQEKEQEIPIKSTVTFREPQSSGISTQDLRLDASDVNSACNPSQLPPHLPPSGRASLEQATNNPDAPNAFFQKLILKNLTDSTQQSVTKQSNIQAISNKTDRATKALDLEEQNAGPPTSSSQGENLPSERKKQRTDDSMGVLLEKEGVGSQEEDNTMLRQNRWLPLMREHTTQKYASITEQNNTVKLKDKVMALRTCPADHPLDQKLIQLKEYASSSSQETTCRTSALTKSSFLPKYQLKLPQSTDSMTSTSRLSSDTAERLPSTPHPQITEKHLPPTTLTMAEAQTSTPDLASVDTCAERPTAICVDSQSLLTPSGMKPSVMANHSVAIVTSISAHSEASSPSSSSQIPQYKGKLTLLNSPTPIAADDNGHDRNQAGDVQVFLQIVSGEQLSVTEYQKESKQEVDSSKGILQEESKFADSPVGISAARKPQELICHEVQPPPRVAQKTTKPETALGGTSGKASGTPLPCSSSEWDATLHTEQHRGTDEFSQQSSVHSKTAVEPVRSARRENFEKSQNEAHSDSNLEEPDAADLETFMQKQGGSAGYGDALLLKPPLSSFQEDAGQMHNVSSETCAAAKPAASLTEIPEAAERLTVSLLEAPPPPAPVSVPADWKVRPRSPCSLKSSCLAVHQQSHIKAPQKALTCNNVSSSSGRSSPSPAAVQQQHKLMEMASVLQKTSASVITPSQLTSNKKSSLSPCQEQKIFTCEPQHPSLPPHTSLSMILPSDQSPGLEDFDMARRKGTTDTEQMSQIPTDSSPSSSETMSLIPVTADVYQRNGQPMQCKEKKIFLFDKVSPEKHDTFRKEAPNSAEPQVADICCDASLLGEKANLGSQVHIPLSSNERLKVLRHKDTETGSSAPAPLDVSPAQGNRTDRDIKNVFSCAVSVGMLPQASSNTLPAFDQQATDSGALRFQHKPTRTPSLHSSPPATTETSSRGLLVHMVSQHDKRTQGFAFRMGKLNSECENDGAVPSQTHPGHLAQAGKMLDASRANLGQYGAASPFSLSNASLNKNKLYPDSVTTTPGSLLPDKSKSTAAALVTSDAHCQPIPGSLDSQLHHATGTGLRTRSLATNTGDGSQDESTAPHDKPEAGQREAAASCYTSGTQPDAQSTGGLAHLCGISHPAAGHPHGGQPSCGGPQEERNAWSDGQPGGGEEGEQDGGDPGVTPSLGRDKGGFTEVVGVERDAGGEEAKIDDELRQRGSPSHLRAVIGLQMSVQDTTILKGQLQLQSMAKEVTTSYSERCRLHVRQLPVQSGATLSPTFPSSLTENFALKGETGSSLPSSSRNPIPGQLTSGTSLLSAIQSPDQGEVHHQRKLRQPEKMKRGQQSLPHLSSSSSSILLEHPLLAEAAQLAGEAETPAGSIEGRSSTSHSLKRGLLSLNEGIQHEGSASGVPRTSARDDPSSASQRSTQNVGRVPTWPEFSGFVPSRPASSRPQLIRSQTSPAFCLVPPGGSVKGQGRAEESPVKVGVSSQEEAVDSSSSDDEGKLVIELE